ncbi:MAG: GDP-mannose 4,6-dehydratase [Rhabdaerophilum sp.]
MLAGISPSSRYRRILLTGGNGFVGSHLVPMIEAFSPSAEVLALIRPGSEAGAVSARWQLASVDLEDGESLGAIVGKFQPDLVVHLAAQASVGQSGNAAELTWRTNVGGTLSLARAVLGAGGSPTFLFSSSSEVYGASFKLGAVDELAPLQPQNCYARTKVVGEQLLTDLLAGQLPLVISRAFNHLGVGQDERFVVPSFAAQIARIERGEQPPVLSVGNIEVARDFLDVRDVCRAYCLLMAVAPSEPGVSVFNISSGRPTKIRQLLECFQSLSQKPFTLSVDPARLRPHDIPEAVGLNARLVEKTGWAPEHDLEQTLAAILNAVRQG